MTTEAEFARLERELARVGAKRNKARAAADAASEEAKPLILALHQAGYTKTDIAAIGGYNVRAIHDILRKAGIGPTRRRRRLTSE